MDFSLLSSTKTISDLIVLPHFFEWALAVTVSSVAIVVLISLNRVQDRSQSLSQKNKRYLSNIPDDHVEFLRLLSASSLHTVSLDALKVSSADADKRLPRRGSKPLQGKKPHLQILNLFRSTKVKAPAPREIPILSTDLGSMCDEILVAHSKFQTNEPHDALNLFASMSDRIAPSKDAPAVDPKAHWAFAFSQFGEALASEKTDNAADASRLYKSAFLSMTRAYDLRERGTSTGTRRKT